MSGVRHAHDISPRSFTPECSPMALRPSWAPVLLNTPCPPLYVVRTFRSAVTGRPEGLHYTRDIGPGETMNEISDGAIMAALGRQMTTAVARQVVAAGN